MRPTDRPDIRSLDLFQRISEDNFDALMRGAYVQNFPPQVDLITEGDPSDFLHIVVEGSVELFASWNGRETTMATIRPVSSFLLAASIKDAPYLTSARTAEKCRVVLLPSMDVREVFKNDQDFARAVVSELADSYRRVLKDTKDLKLRTSIERLANYLLRAHFLAGEDAEFDLSIEKKRLASLLGMTPENLSRAIKSLRAYGVEIDGAHVHLTDLDDLRAFAKPTPLIDDPNR